MQNMIRVDKTTLYGMDRFKEMAIQKRIKDVGEVADSCIKAFAILEEFKYLTYTLLAVVLEIHNYNNLKKVVENDLKAVISFLRGVVKEQGVNSSKELEKAFSDRFDSFCELYPELYINDYEKEHEYLAKSINTAVYIILIITKQFNVVLKHLSYENDFIANINKINVYLEEIKNSLKPKKVNKYQKFVGMNLKNWRGI